MNSLKIKIVSFIFQKKKKQTLKDNEALKIKIKQKITVL